MGRPGEKLRIAQYKLEGEDAVRIGFDKLQSEPPYKFKAKFDGDVLYLDRDKFGVRKSMPPELVSKVRAQCTAPILQGQKSAGAADQGEEQLPKNARLLTPIKIFELDAKQIAGEPLFPAKPVSHAGGPPSGRNPCARGEPCGRDTSCRDGSNARKKKFKRAKGMREAYKGRA